MTFFKSIHAITAVLAAAPSTLNINETTSVQSVAKTIAAGAMSYYPGNATTYADLPAPYYWWECGGLMGSMLDYSHYTGDGQYDEAIATALLAQTGPQNDFMVPKHFGDEGNDDQSFWGFAVLAAAERNFPQPNADVPSWLDLGVNLWNSMAGRWNTTMCGGGLTWQIFPSNPNGMNYKNSVSNGGLFQLSARLARATGNATYLEWATKVWDWTTAVGLLDGNYNVYDGTDSATNCSQINYVSFSYSQGIFLYGAAVLANHTDDPVWATRAQGLLEASKSYFGGPTNNVTDVMYEHACEQVDTCNTDMKSFKGYLSRFMYQSTLMLPALVPAVDDLLRASAAAAAKACTGGTGGTTCGQKWYVDGFDGSVGLGQEMSALETVQGLLVAGSVPPFQGDQIQVVRTFSASPTATPAAQSPTATPTKRDNAAGAVGPDMRWITGAVVAASVLLLAVV